MVVTLPVAPHATTAQSPGALRVVHFTDTYLPRRDGIVTALRALTEALTAEGHHCLTVVPKHREQVPDRSVLQLVSVPCGVADVRLLPWPTLRIVATASQRLGRAAADHHRGGCGPAGARSTRSWTPTRRGGRRRPRWWSWSPDPARPIRCAVAVIAGSDDRTRVLGGTTGGP